MVKLSSVSLSPIPLMPKQSVAKWFECSHRHSSNELQSLQKCLLHCVISKVCGFSSASDLKENKNVIDTFSGDHEFVSAINVHLQ